DDLVTGVQTCALPIFEGQVEVVFNGPFPPARDDDDVLDAGTDRFLDRILDQGLVDQRQHLFGRGLRGWQEASSEAGGRNDGLGRSEGRRVGKAGGWRV